MKIIDLGTPKTCPRCSCYFRYKKRDIKWHVGYSTRYVKCPYCGKLIFLYGEFYGR